MNVRFVGADPRHRARPELDDVLFSGTDQLAIACAFLTPGGVETLKRHADRLRLPGSFVVLAWEEPTSEEALNELHALIPGHLYVHLGSLTPKEKDVGAALMHSKVFYARGGSRCRLWTGSHNLTASAMQGANCEAAVVLEGGASESVFVDALLHLEQCRSEAILFDPRSPLPELRPEHTLIIHAECHTALKQPPWFVHLRPENTDYDRAMRPPEPAWIYLYNPGSLRMGVPRPHPLAVYSGALTALNFTEQHPRHSGISADWEDADFVIELKRGIPSFIDPTPHARTPSQGIIRVEQSEDRGAVWLIDNPTPKEERVVGLRRVAEIDPEFERFFTRQSVANGKLFHQEYRDTRTVTRISRKEAGPIGPGELQIRLPVREGSEIVITETVDTGDPFSFIYRAKFRA